MRKICLLFFVLCLFTFTGFVLAQNAPNEILISNKSAVKQGSTVFINIKNAEKVVNPTFEFNNKKVKMYKQKDASYRGVLGIDASIVPGQYQIFLDDDSHTLNKEVFINVVSGKFPIQNITISGSKSTLEATKYELDKIQKAKDTFSSISFWDSPPYISPTKGCMISVYGLSRYHNGVPTGDFHKGVDIKAPQGQEIDSIAGGKVLIAEQFKLNGGTVAVDHGQGVLSFYLHMSKITAKPGQIVKAGQKIGEIGSTGFATGPHLHWGLYINGTPVNPMFYWIKPVNRC